MIIGLAGTIGSGKGAVADYLVGKGFVQLVYSDEIVRELERRNLKVTRDNLQNVGNEMRTKYGRDYWTRCLLKNVMEDNDYVLDGARNPGELVPLLEREDALLIGVDAPFCQRIKRVIEREDLRDGGSVQEVIARLKRDMGFGEDENGQQALKCYEMAQVRIYNDKTLKDLIAKIDEVIGDIKC